MTAWEQIRQAALTALKGGGVNAVGEYDAQRAKKLDEPVLAVGLKRVKTEKSGLLEYLGEREDKERGTVEVYGRRMCVELALEAYAPRGVGASGCDVLSGEAAAALCERLSPGVSVDTVDWEQTLWDERYGAFLRRGSACCYAYFTAEAAQEDGAVLTDFVLKGVIGTNDDA